MNTRIVFLISTFSIISLFNISCGPNTRVLGNKMHDSAIERPNILSRAAPPNVAQNAPWDARDVDVLNVAKLRVPGSGIVQAAVVSTSSPCPGGGSVTQSTDNQPPPWFSEGDKYTTSYASCIRGNTELNGAQTFTVDVMTGQAYVDSNWSLSTTIGWENLVRTTIGTADNDTVNGSTTEKTTVINTTSYTQEFLGNTERSWSNNGTQRMSKEAYQITYQWDDLTGQYTWEFSVATESTSLGKEEMHSVEIFTGVLGAPPVTGQFLLTKTDLANAVTVMQVTAVGNNQVKVETDNNNDGAFDKTEVINWNQLILNSNLYRFL